eukprot:7682401-Alexandrium_andersonii.AAC.1
MWRCEPAPAGVAPQVVPHVAQEAAPPPRPRAAQAPRRVNEHHAGNARGAWVYGRMLETHPHP